MLPGRWFARYAVLGDDIIIADKRVAERYLANMRDLGVGIGLAKSLVSPKGTAEFAKRYFTPKDASPISVKESVVAWHTVGNLVDLVRKRNRESLSLANVLAFIGYGYKVRGAVNKRLHRMSLRMRHWILLLTYPGAPFEVPLDK